MTPTQIRELRLSLGMTQQDLAEYLGLKYKSQVTKLEGGHTQPSGPILRLLAMLRDSGGSVNRIAARK